VLCLTRAQACPHRAVTLRQLPLSWRGWLLQAGAAALLAVAGRWLLAA
jgi:hypothetical protein